MSLIKCPDCGKEVSDKAPACPSCGCPLASSNSTSEPEFIDSNNNVIRCPKCGGININFQIQEVSSKTKKKKTSLLHKAARATMVLSTAGLWALTPGPDGKERAKVKSGTFAVCQSCGKSWKVK